MWPTHASEKNKIIFEPPQPPCKLNQNDVKKNRKENAHPTPLLPPKKKTLGLSGGCYIFSFDN
jgi:hypothetical protein